MDSSERENSMWIYNYKRDQIKKLHFKTHGGRGEL